MLFWNFFAFSVIQQMLAIWSLVSLRFLNPAYTSGSLQFMYCWSLAWRTLSFTLLACETTAVVRLFEGSLSLPSFWLEWKLTSSSPVATAEFSKFIVTLSASLEHHHLFVVSLYFFALITEEGFLISPCSSLEPCIQMDIPFLSSFAFSFSSFLRYL